jgi:hypothetical protein
MDLVPSFKQIRLLFSHDAQSASSLREIGADAANDRWLSVFAHKIDLGLAVTKHMDMRRRMIVGVDYDAQPVFSKDGGHLS